MGGVKVKVKKRNSAWKIVTSDQLLMFVWKHEIEITYM